MAALITLWSAYLSETPTDSTAAPTATATETITAAPTETELPTDEPTPRVTVTVTAGPDIRVVLPSSLAISIDSGDAPSGDGGGGNAGLITAIGGFLTGVGAVITGFVTWLSLRRKRDEDEDEEIDGKGGKEVPETPSTASPA
ncbi:hypothetical protein J5X84_29485 [Streptosporangiaceae bacterium NEAU-GS5]|nr:hypothetical protein [Streptosporangiaceae bacterium NEAU-GS5]